MKNKIIFTLLFYSTLVVAYSAEGATAKSLTQYGVTWTFSQPVEYGQYANSDYWVKGPVTIINIDPKSDGLTNGSMLNMKNGREHGFDNRIRNNVYNSSLNIENELPKTVSPQSQIISAVSITQTSSGRDPQIKSYSILTIVDSTPPAGAFRPAYIGGDYTHPWKESDLDYSVFARKNLSGLGAPNISNIENPLGVIVNEQTRTWTGHDLHAADASLPYGRDIANKTSDYLLLLNSDASNSQKRDILIGMVQYGIDIFGILKTGGKWNADGGINCGRMAPLLVAGASLNNQEMLSLLNGDKMLFQELQQTFYVTNSDIGVNLYTADGRPRTPYTNEDIGKPEFGIRHTENKTLDGDNWDAYYRDISGGILPALAIGIQVMGMKDVINHPALFDYARRHIYYRQGLFTLPENYNGWDDGDDYGDGNTNKSAPFSSNETLSFHRNFYFAFESDYSNPTDNPTLPKIDITSLTTGTTSATINITTNITTTANIRYSIFGTELPNATLLSPNNSSHTFDISQLTPGTKYNYEISATDSTNNESTLSGIFTTSQLTSSINPPSLYPSSASFNSTITVEITSALKNQVIHYTTDKTTPTSNSPTYLQPIVVSNTTTIKAISMDAEGDTSPVTEATYYNYNINSNGEWINIQIPNHENTLYVQFDTTIKKDAINSIIGVATTEASNYSDLAANIRFNSSGYIDARNGNTYGAVESMPYKNGHTYRVSLVINLDNNTFSAKSADTLNLEQRYTIAESFSFRNSVNSTSPITNLVFKAIDASSDSTSNIRTYNTLDDAVRNPSSLAAQEQL